MSWIMGHVRSKTRSPSQISEKPCYALEPHFEFSTSGTSSEYLS